MEAKNQGFEREWLHQWRAPDFVTQSSDGTDESHEWRGIPVSDGGEPWVPRHNHFTRDVKDEGRCPECDRYWESAREVDR